MPYDLACSIRLYAWMVEQLPRYDERDQVINAFVTRELIHDALSAGETIPADVMALLEAADRMLFRRRRRLLRRFPEMFEENRDAPSEYWWWHLDQAPDGRAPAGSGSQTGLMRGKITLRPSRDNSPAIHSNRKQP